MVQALLLLLLLGRGPAFAQGNVQEWSATPKNSETTNEVPPAPSEEAGPATDDTAEIERARQKLAADPTLQLGQQIDADLVALQNAVKGGATSVDILKNPKLRHALGDLWQRNPMKDMNETKLKAMMNDSSSPLAPVLRAFPGGEKFVLGLMRSPDAIPQLLKIFDKSEALKVWLGVAIGLMIVFWAVKKKVVKEKWPWWKKFFVRAGFSLGFMACMTLTLVVLFREELGPTIKVAFETLV